MSPPVAGRARPFGLLLLLTMAGLLLALAFVELGVRLIRPQPAGTASASSLLRGRFHQPGTHPNVSDEFSVQVHVNQHGFVDREWAPPSPGVPRVVILGDSFVEAAQVELEQGFGRVLEATMGRQAPVQVLSMGVPGAGTATALALLEQQALALDPQLVVLGFLVSNDVLNNHPLLEPKDDKPFYRLDDEHLVPTDAQQARASAWQVPLLWSSSHTWRLLARAVVSRQLSQQRIEQGEGMPIDLRVHDPAGGPLWEEAWQLSDALVGAMAARCEARGVAFATLIFPSQVEATDRGRQAAVAAWPELASWDLDRATARAVNMAGRHGPVLDLTPALRAVQHQAPLYYAQDGHWTPAGHRVAAEAAAPFLAPLLQGGP